MLMPASNSDTGRLDIIVGGPGGYREDLGRVAIVVGSRQARLKPLSTPNQGIDKIR